MRTLLIRLTFTLLALTVATAAAAGGGTFRSTGKTVPVKQTADYAKGLLDCSGAVEVALENSYAGDTTGLPNTVSTYGCSTWDESGGEMVYHLYLPEPTMFEAWIVTDGCDLDLAVLDACDEDLGCQIVVDGGVETLVPISGDIWFVVDGYAGAACGFTFNVATLVPPEPTAFCDQVEDVTGTEFSGTTCGGTNLISSLGCEDFSENGLEVYYEILMPAGSSFTADVANTTDGALWVVDACAAPIGCLAYADDTLAGGTESIAYTNASSGDMIVYLVVDSWDTDSCGDYTLTFAASGGAVAVEETSFGALKARFR